MTSPYRQLAVVEKEIPVRIDGLLLRKVVPHKCSLPEKYTICFRKRILFGLISYPSSRQEDIPAGSLYKCPGCKKLYHRDYLFRSDNSATYWASPSYGEGEKYEALWEEEVLKENNIIER